MQGLDDGFEAYAALKAQNAAARKAGESPVAPRGNGPPVIHLQVKIPFYKPVPMHLCHLAAFFMPLATLWHLLHHFL